MKKLYAVKLNTGDGYECCCDITLCVYEKKEDALKIVETDMVFLLNKANTLYEEWLKNNPEPKFDGYKDYKNPTLIEEVELEKCHEMHPIWKRAKENVTEIIIATLVKEHKLPQELGESIFSWDERNDSLLCEEITLYD